MLKQSHHRGGMGLRVHTAWQSQLGERQAISRGFLEEGLSDGWRDQPGRAGGKGVVPERACSKSLKHKEHTLCQNRATVGLRYGGQEALKASQHLQGPGFLAKEPG